MSFLVIRSFNTHTQLWRRWLRAPWVLNATSSWMDSLLVSHQLPFLPPSRTSSCPPPPLCVLKSTNWATPALLPTSPLSCSSPLRVYTLKGPREPTGLTVDTLARAHTHSHCPSSHHQQVIVSAFSTPRIPENLLPTRRGLHRSATTLKPDSWNEKHFLPCCGAIFCCGFAALKPSTWSTRPWVSATTLHCRHNQRQWV